MSILLTLADLMSWRLENKEAQAIYLQVLQQSPDNIFALNNLAVLLSMFSGNSSLAMKSVTQAIDKGGPMDSLLDTRGLVQLLSGHSELAIADFKQSVFEKESAENQFHLAVAYAAVQKFQEAKDSLAIAEKLGLYEEELHPKEREKLKRLRSQLGTGGQKK